VHEVWEHLVVHPRGDRPAPEARGRAAVGVDRGPAAKGVTGSYQSWHLCQSPESRRGLADGPHRPTSGAHPKTGAIVGSVPRGPCADKQRVRGRTAPSVPTKSVVPLIRCADLRWTQIVEARFALMGKVCAHSRYRRIAVAGFNMNEWIKAWPERSEKQVERMAFVPPAPTGSAGHCQARSAIARHSLRALSS